MKEIIIVLNTQLLSSAKSPFTLGAQGLVPLYMIANKHGDEFHSSMPMAGIITLNSGQNYSWREKERN